MDVNLPTNGCNISQSNGFIDNYYNGTRTRYTITENKLVQSYRTTYTSIPTGYTCLNTGDIIYKPELAVYFQIISLALVGIATLIIFKIIIGRLLR